MSNPLTEIESKTIDLMRPLLAFMVLSASTVVNLRSSTESGPLTAESPGKTNRKTYSITSGTTIIPNAVTIFGFGISNTLKILHLQS